MEGPPNETIKRHPGNQPDEYVRCPYFPEHELRRSRLPYHIIKCQANPNAPKLLICPFNFLHRVKPEDKREHMILCEDKIMTRYADRDPPSIAKTRREYLKVHGNNKENKNHGDKTEDGEEWW